APGRARPPTMAWADHRRPGTTPSPIRAGFAPREEFAGIFPYAVGRDVNTAPVGSCPRGHPRHRSVPAHDGPALLEGGLERANRPVRLLLPQLPRLRRSPGRLLH